MLLFSNPFKCDSTLATRLSHYFVALNEDGKSISGLKQFNTDTEEAVDLDGNLFRPASWVIHAPSTPLVGALTWASRTRQIIADAGLTFADKVQVVGENMLRCSFCAPRELRHAFADLWRSSHRYSLQRSPEEHQLALGMYRAERALDRIDLPLYPYLDRINTETSPVSTYLSCDGNRNRQGGYVDFRTSLGAEDVARLFVEMRYIRRLRGMYTLGISPRGLGPDQFYLSYTLKVDKPGWEVFEPVLNGFCDTLKL